MSLPQLFGIVPTGQPCITNPTSAPSQTQLVYTLSTARPFNHIVVFLLPGVELPPDTAAAVYLAYPSPGQTQTNAAPNFKFLGGIGPGKESAIFKVNGSNGSKGDGSLNVELDNPDAALILGISIESSTSVSQQMAALAAKPPIPTINEPSSALVKLSNTGEDDKARTVMLAQRIIKNAFNFLASFSGNVPVPGASGMQGVEVVPLKAFEDWWRKFEGRVRNDPGFLEKETD